MKKHLDMKFFSTKLLSKCEKEIALKYGSDSIKNNLCFIWDNTNAQLHNDSLILLQLMNWILVSLSIYIMNY